MHFESSPIRKKKLRYLIVRLFSLRHLLFALFFCSSIGIATSEKGKPFSSLKTEETDIIIVVISSIRIVNEIYFTCRSFYYQHTFSVSFYFRTFSFIFLHRLHHSF